MGRIRVAPPWPDSLQLGRRVHLFQIEPDPLQSSLAESRSRVMPATIPTLTRTSDGHGTVTKKEENTSHASSTRGKDEIHKRKATVKLPFQHAFSMSNPEFPLDLLAKRFQHVESLDLLAKPYTSHRPGYILIECTVFAAYLAQSPISHLEHSVFERSPEPILGARGGRIRLGLPCTTVIWKLSKTFRGA